ncbi:hypothetical protein [Microscilla marina]|uniref:Uncharacterized protein n=1 Tax=Microscilla marina ATCC 23134 TaxID=313606 RepID=A1ZQT5_MICM2|nr:hypothetical protein [Microscilla marina]EAY27240.1 hypothetical protein M23134_06550 [Microscilla marina ATCC 23134]
MNFKSKKIKLKNQGFTQLSKQQLITITGGNAGNTKDDKDKNDCGNNNQKNGPITSPINPNGTEICIDGNG